MSKAYLTYWEKRNRSYPKTDFVFDHDPAKAILDDSKDQADIDCSLLTNFNIAVASPIGATHHCISFQTEKRSRDEFVIFCEFPWLPRARSSLSK